MAGRACDCLEDEEVPGENRARAGHRRGAGRLDTAREGMVEAADQDVVPDPHVHVIRDPRALSQNPGKVRLHFDEMDPLSDQDGRVRASYHRRAGN